MPLLLALSIKAPLEVVVVALMAAHPAAAVGLPTVLHSRMPQADAVFELVWAGAYARRLTAIRRPHGLRGSTAARLQFDNVCSSTRDVAGRILLVYHWQV